MKARAAIFIFAQGGTSPHYATVLLQMQQLPMQIWKIFLGGDSPSQTHPSEGEAHTPPGAFPLPLP